MSAPRNARSAQSDSYRTKYEETADGGGGSPNPKPQPASVADMTLTSAYEQRSWKEKKSVISILQILKESCTFEFTLECIPLHI